MVLDSLRPDIFTCLLLLLEFSSQTAPGVEIYTWNFPYLWKYIRCHPKFSFLNFVDIKFKFLVYAFRLLLSFWKRMSFAVLHPLTDGSTIDSTMFNNVHWMIVLLFQFLTYCIREWISGWMFKDVREWMNEWLDGRMDGQIDESCSWIEIKWLS